MKGKGECVKWGVWGIVLGAIGAMMVGFIFGGWVTGGTANSMATERAEKAETTVLTPVCVEKAKTPAEAKKLAALVALKEKGSYEQADFVANKETGWAKFGGDQLNRRVAEACAAELLFPTAGKQAAGK